MLTGGHRLVHGSTC